MNYNGNPNRFNNPRGDHGHRPQARDNSSVSSGTSGNCPSRAAPTPRVIHANHVKMDYFYHAFPGTLELSM